MTKMKIMTGMGCIDDYPSFVKVGADEVFIGYVPQSWSLHHGRREALNRREVIYYNVQAGSFSELMILSDMEKDLGIPITLALNSLQYDPDTYPEILEIMKQCMRIGIRRFILADEGLLQYLKKENNINYQDMEIVASGEYGELNAGVLQHLCELGARRIIFPRQTSIEEMAALIEKAPELEYEAFVLNEKCHYTGAYCNSLHCDELCHMCKLPYRLSGPKEKVAEREEDPYDLGQDFPIGFTGCGLCALWKLRQIGITHLKLVSRGNGEEETIRDIKALKKAMEILEESTSEEEYISQMKELLFPLGCGGNCYYI